VRRPGSPRNVALSFDNHRANQDRQALVRARASVTGTADEDPVKQVPRLATVRERFWAWVDNPAPPMESGSTLRMMLHHLDTFWRVRDQPNIVLLHFSDLTADLDGQMRALAGRLGIAVPEQPWPDLVSAAGIEHMRAHADELAPEADKGLWLDNSRFFVSGSNGQWSALLDQADMARYHRQVAELADADLAAWVHREPP
jgi:hypothetical protein